MMSGHAASLTSQQALQGTSLCLGHASRPRILRQRRTVQPVVAAAAKKLVLVLNAGSSSLKFKLFANNALAGLRTEVAGLVERIGDVQSSRMIIKRVLGSGPTHETCAIDQAFKVRPALCVTMPPPQRQFCLLST